MTQIKITIEPGKPSESYPPEERESNGALDYLVAVRDGSVQFSAGITLYRDDVNGGMSPCGTPLDVWCSGELIAWMRRLDDSARAEVLEHLSYARRDCKIARTYLVESGE